MGQYSALGSIYHRESPDALLQCLESLVIATQGDEAEIVLVQDGPIGPELHAVVDAFRARLNIVDVVLPKNVGLGPALNNGLARCSHSLVARFDTDDIYTPQRFRLQLAEFANRPQLVLLGGWIAEFEFDPAHCHAQRRTPISHTLIKKYARKRNPFNHMTVMFRKQAVLSAGGYGEEYLFEDYALWVRMIQAGCETDNVPSIITYARTGAGMYQRRGGWRYACSELRLLRWFHSTGFVSTTTFLMNAATRMPVRLLPAMVRGWIYRHSLRRGEQMAN